MPPSLLADNDEIHPQYGDSQGKPKRVTPW
jgi:hypothetical protein